MGLDLPAIRQLYKSIDFVGLSKYMALRPGAHVTDLEQGIRVHALELSLMGVGSSQQGGAACSWAARGWQLFGLMPGLARCLMPGLALLAA